MKTSELSLHKETIKKGSKSFSLASFFFSTEEREAAWKLYSWCRYCDDEIDEVPSLAEARIRLKHLVHQTERLATCESFEHFQMQGMSEIVKKYEIPMKYPLDLLRGMEMDVSSTRFQTLEELEDYCYCVAGTVGLMMCHILGIRNDGALIHALAMGKAMQLTNICRDIEEDRARGRLYLPLAWLKEKGIFEEELFNFSHENSLLEIQERLLKRADELYQEGYAGLKYLSLRSSWAVLIAAKIYSHIGFLIRRDPSLSLQKRIFVSKMRKVMIILSTFKPFLSQLWWSCIQGEEIKRPTKVWSIGGVR